MKTSSKFVREIRVRRAGQKVPVLIVPDLSDKSGSTAKILNVPCLTSVDLSTWESELSAIGKIECVNPIGSSGAEMGGGHTVQQGAKSTGTRVSYAVKFRKSASVAKVRDASCQQLENWFHFLSDEDRAQSMSLHVSGIMGGYSSLAELKQSTDHFMTHFDQEVNKERQQIMDDRVAADGGNGEWQLVTSRGRGGHASIDPTTVLQLQRNADKSDSKILKDFYRHQQREKKRSELEKLRKQFEDDKRRIQRMRQERRFRPY